MKKSLDKSRRYVVENKFSKSPDVQMKLNIESEEDGPPVKSCYHSP